MRYDLIFTAALAAALCQPAFAQNPPAAPQAPAAAKTPPTIDAPPIPVRPSPGDYQGHASTGPFTIAAEFTAHAVVTPNASFSNEDYVTVEVALYGPAGAHLRLSLEDFSLRINGKKAVPSQSFVLLQKALKDPSYVPPEEEKKADKGDAGVPVVGESPSDRNPQWHPVPFEITHAMEVRVQKATLPEGDRNLPQAGLVYFPYKGRDNSVTSVELLYDGPAGRAVVPLHP